MADRNLLSEALAHLRMFGGEPSLDIEIEWAAPGFPAELKWSEDGHDFSLHSVGSAFIGKGVRICCRIQSGHFQAERWFDPKADTLADILAFVESPEEEG